MAGKNLLKVTKISITLENGAEVSLLEPTFLGALDFIIKYFRLSELKKE